MITADEIASFPAAGFDSLRVAQVSAADVGGGAERVALDLHLSFLARGVDADLWVGHRWASTPRTYHMDNDAARSWWARRWLGDVDRDYPNVVRRVVAEPVRRFRKFRGYEDFDYPASARAAREFPQKYDLVHLHNLHGQYFDLRALPALTHRVPVFMTLHDAWLLSGHCAHSLECNRWLTGCGNCPDLTLNPAIRRDATAENWRRKRDIFARSRVRVACPSRWLAKRVEDSLMSPALEDLRVIPNGVDLSVFHPGDRDASRSRLGLPADARVLLFSALGGRDNPWKDYSTLREAVQLVADVIDERLVLLVLGGDESPDRTAHTTVVHVPHTQDRSVVADYYRAADVYVHAALADTFPNVILEALACATPVIATSVGGIPEQVRALDLPGQATDHASTDATGVLVRPRRPREMAEAIEVLLSKPGLLGRLSANAAADARTRFDAHGHAATVLAWYAECVNGDRAQAVDSGSGVGRGVV